MYNTYLVFTDQPCTWRCTILQVWKLLISEKAVWELLDHNPKLKSHDGKQNLKCNAMEPMVWQMVGNICGTISDVHRLTTIQIEH